MRKQSNNNPHPPKLCINTDTKIETLHIWLIAIICCYLLHPFWKNWWSLHSDWLSARWFIYRLHNILVWRCEGRRNKLGDKLQQQITPCVHVARLVLGSHCSDTSQWQIPSSVCLCNRILLPQQVPQILYDLTFCDMLLRQNSVTETKIFTVILQYTQSDLSPWCVAVTHCCNLLSSVYWP